MGSVEWGPDVAAAYDETSAAMFAPELLEATVAVLADLAGDGAALELAVGTGRVALALAARDVPVHGIELSPHMAAELRRKPGAEAIGLTMGDMCTARVHESFRLVYLVFNTIMNVTTQDEQVAVFENAARHLEPGGTFLVEVLVPQLRGLPVGELARVFTMEDGHVGVETFDDVATQLTWSHHWIRTGERLVHHAAPYRYVWPAELDLMARCAGMRLVHRWADWQRSPFAQGPGHIAVYEKPPT